MGYLTEATDRLYLPSSPEYWVEMKRIVTVGVRRVANEAVAGIPEPERTYACGIAVCFQLITAWNLTDANDQPLALGPRTEAPDSMPLVDLNFLVGEAQARMLPRSEEEERPFVRRSQPTSPRASRSKSPRK